MGSILNDFDPDHIPRSPMFRIKICGITNPADAKTAAEAGADAIGLNFYTGSPRYITPERAAEVGAELPDSVEKVGVFVGLPVEEVLRIAGEARLNALQLHGDETPEAAAEVLQASPQPVYIAIRCREPSLAGVARYLAQLAELSRLPDAILLDAYEPGSFGGTGLRLDWHAIDAERQHLGDVPLILAGGLKGTNVAQAIARARPAAVDVASGVEAAPGQKNPALVQEFIRRAKAAFDELAAQRAN
jgi:phosphoribosylanthranilate isomerase